MLLLYVFGIVVDEFMKNIAEVVENEALWFCARKYEAEVVAKKLFWVFQ